MLSTHSEKIQWPLGRVQMGQDALLCALWPHPHPTQPTSEQLRGTLRITTGQHEMSRDGLYTTSRGRRQYRRRRPRRQAQGTQLITQLCTNVMHLRDTLHHWAGQLQGEGEHTLPFISRTESRPRSPPRNHGPTRRLSYMRNRRDPRRGNGRGRRRGLGRRCPTSRFAVRRLLSLCDRRHFHERSDARRASAG